MTSETIKLPLRKHRGAASELRATVWLLELGYEVFRNVSPFGAVDIVARHPETGEMFFADVKTATYKKVSRIDGSVVEYYSGPKNSNKPAHVRYLFVYNTGEISWESLRSRVVTPATRQPVKFSKIKIQ
tara:strand:- start:29 stop:415 length:387 start_codon:yes stop_codon:yes gene_type:complete